MSDIKTIKLEGTAETARIPMSHNLESGGGVFRW